MLGEFKTYGAMGVKHESDVLWFIQVGYAFDQPFLRRECIFPDTNRGAVEQHCPKELRRLSEIEEVKRKEVSKDLQRL